MTQETFQSRRPIKAELYIIHQYTDPNSTKDRTLSDIVKEVGSDQLILDLIEYRQACDHYEEWKEHPKETVRLSLATNGYFLDRYVHDIDDRIKYAAISKQPELMIDLLANPTNDELRFARDYLYDQWSPDVEHLKAYLDAAHADDESKDYKTKALLTKYLSDVVELDAFTKTMTAAQLFTVNHPAWARGYDPKRLHPFTILLAHYSAQDTPLKVLMPIYCSLLLPNIKTIPTIIIWSSVRMLFQPLKNRCARISTSRGVAYATLDNGASPQTPIFS